MGTPKKIIPSNLGQAGGLGGRTIHLRIVHLGTFKFKM